MRVFLANAEQFVDLYQTLQSVLPQGQNAAPVRLRRTSRVGAAAESTLGETLGAETDVLVVVDPVGLPRGFYSVDVLAEQIGDAVYRAHTDEAPARLPPPSFRDVQDADVDSAHRGAEASSPPGGLPSTWGRDMQGAAARLRARVTLGDPHLDAKLFPGLLPHGTGSCRAEAVGGGLQRYCRTLL